MLSAEDNERLTRTGPGTLMGAFFRGPSATRRAAPAGSIPLPGCYTWNSDRPLTEAECQRFRAGQSMLAQVDERRVPLRNRDNDYLIGRQDQKRVTFTGIRGCPAMTPASRTARGSLGAHRTARR